MAVATPYIARAPIVTINGVDFTCHARKITLVPEDEMSDVATFCNPGGVAPGTTHWTCTISALQSFGPESSAAGLWETLLALRKTKQVIVIKPSGTLTGAPNQMATFSAWIPSIPFIDSEIGGTTTMDIDFPVIGEPVFATAA
jgi:hypothetical protein